MDIKITFHNSNPDTIWNKLAEKLGREPTHAEACAEVRRILQETTAELREDQRPRAGGGTGT